MSKYSIEVSLTRGDVDFLEQVIEFLTDILDEAQDALAVEDSDGSR